MSDEERTALPGKLGRWLWGKAWQLKEELEAQARYLTRGDPEADDLVQELWVVAIEKLDTLRDQEKIGEWLRAILRNLAVTWHRKRSRSPVSLPEIDFVAPDTGPLEELLREESLKLEKQHAWELVDLEFYWSPPSRASCGRRWRSAGRDGRSRPAPGDHEGHGLPEPPTGSGVHDARRHSGRPYAIGWYLIFAAWKRHHAEKARKPLDETGAGPA